MTRWLRRVRDRLIGLLSRGSAVPSASPKVTVSTDDRPLLVLAGVGPAQELLAESVRAAWSDRCAVLWLDPSSEATSASLRTTAEELSATRVLAVGVESVSAAHDALPDLPIDGVFLHHELDFRYSNSSRRSRLLGAFSACARLWFDSTVAMDKASAHGSDRPHLLIPLPVLPQQDAGRPPAGGVAIVTSHEALTAAEERTVATLQEAVERAGGHSAVYKVDQLYTGEDLSLGRTWSDAVRHRLPDETAHAVLIGKSGHHFYAAAGLLAQSVEVSVEANVENSGLARRLQLDEHHTARGAALIERVAAAVSGRETNPRARVPAVSSGSDFATRIAVRDLPDWYEESILDVDRPEFDLFFSVAAIENRSDGARPQRIRAMSQAFDDAGVPLVRMTSNANLLSRRLRGAAALVRSGVKPRWGYGENSTAPMPVESREALTHGLSELRRAGLRFAWYVRDFHWLDPNSTVSRSREDLGELREAGLAEFAAMRAVSDVLYAPSMRAARMFDELLRGHHDGETIGWKELPPGVDPANCLSLPVSHPDQSTVLRVMYSGGLGGVYDIGTAMTALSEWGGAWEMHMTVRPEDEAAARRLTAALSGHRIVIESGEFADIPAPEGTAVGLALLDSNYGLASFPLKVMSCLEKRIPVLTYRDSSPADLIETYGAGRVVERGPDSVRAGLEALASNSEPVDWDRLHRCESWNARAHTVRDDLRSLPADRLAVDRPHHDPQ